MSRDEIAARVARYAEVVHAPVALGTQVQRLAPVDGRGFRVVTDRGELRARLVVVATGSYHAPRVPRCAEHVSGRVLQLHSHDYRREADLPPGAVLVVGSGQTGLQLAEELHEAGRSVFISVGSAGRIPRRYRGRDIFRWLVDVMRYGPALGVTPPTDDRLPDGRSRFSAMPALSGHGGGHDTNLRRYAAMGMVLAGRLTGARGERLTFADDLAQNLEGADRFFEERFRGLIDAYIERSAVQAPVDDGVAVDFQPRGLTALDLSAAGVSVIIWATGYALDYRWIDAPIVDVLGIHDTCEESDRYPASTSSGFCGSTRRLRPRWSVRRWTVHTWRKRWVARWAEPSRSQSLDAAPAEARLGSDQGGERAAIAYTVISSCMLADIDPLAYLTDVFQKLAAGWPTAASTWRW